MGRASLLLSLVLVGFAPALEPIPDKLVVLTFDDASKSHHAVARPLLKKYKFGATFFVTEGFDFLTNKKDYMTWAEIKELHADGFEIGNHTRDHKGVDAKNLKDLVEQVRGINARCKEYGIPTPVSFAYPGNSLHPGALPILKDLGLKWARRGGSPEYEYKEGRGVAYEPGLDHPLLIPSTGDARPAWKLDDLKRAVAEARGGRIAVLQFHGVPDTAHAWVNTSQKQFEEYMKYLADEGCIVIAMRDLAKYVDPEVTPSNAWGVIEDRQSLLKAGRPLHTLHRARKPVDEAESRQWLSNMVTHGYTASEIGAAVGRTASQIENALMHLKIRRLERKGDQLFVLPYPGGRHPRIGFLDGAIRPQRETKVSVFAPWDKGGYAVADVPEAVWHEPDGKRELLYLAHTHVPTIWDRKKITLDPLEWVQKPDGSLEGDRTFPNRVRMVTKVKPANDGVRMELSLTNGSDKPLTGLHVQMCVMLKGLTGFDARTNDNKVFDAPFAACHDKDRKRWVITAWEPCVRAWGNPPCPCLHSDPRVPDCGVGETKTVRGWLSFYEGTDVAAELRRLRKVVFPAEPPKRTTLSNPALKYRVPEKPYIVLKRGGVQAVIVDNRAVDDAVLPGHKAGYSGVASLKEAGRTENFFVPAYAGLNFEHIHDGTVQPNKVLYEPRTAPMQLRAIDDHTAELYQAPTPHYALESCQRYQLLDDGTIELTLECIPRKKSFTNGYVGLFWASYINGPPSGAIHFLGHAKGETETRWVEAVTPKHGVEATHPAFDDERVFPHDKAFPMTLVFNQSKWRYREPWYYGRHGDVALVQMFRPRDRVRFTQSPSGGGGTNPAWDFQHFVTDYEVDRRYQMVMRAKLVRSPAVEMVAKLTLRHRRALAESEK